jgi:hypothetical protein
MVKKYEYKSIVRRQFTSNSIAEFIHLLSKELARFCTLFKAYTAGQAWKAIGDRLLKPCYLSRGDHNRKIKSREQRTDVDKYSFVNKTFSVGTNYLKAY